MKVYFGVSLTEMLTYGLELSFPVLQNEEKVVSGTLIHPFSRSSDFFLSLTITIDDSNYEGSIG